MPVHLPWSMPQPQPGFTCADRIQRRSELRNRLATDEQQAKWTPTDSRTSSRPRSSYLEARLAPDVVVVLPRPERMGGCVDADAGAVTAEAAAVAEQRVVCAQTTNVSDNAQVNSSA